MAQASQQESDAAMLLTAVLHDMNAFVARASQCVQLILQFSLEMCTRSTRANCSLRETCAAMNLRITLRAASLKLAATTSHRRASKIFAENVEETATNERLLEVVASICQRVPLASSVWFLPRFLRGVLPAEPEFTPLDVVGGFTGNESTAARLFPLLFCAASTLSPAVCGLSAVWHDAIDAAQCDLEGAGAQRFCTACTNEVAVTFRTTTGALAEYVSVDDIIMAVCDPNCDEVCGSASVPACSEGVWKITYSVLNSSTDTVVLRISACGYLIFQHLVPLARISGTRKHCLEMQHEASNKFGMALSHDGSRLVVSNSNRHALAVYMISTSCDSSAFLYWCGQFGDGPLQFNCPYKLCAGPSDSVLVCEIENKRIQELTDVNADNLVHHRFISAPNARTVAVHDGLLAVGTGAGRIHLLSYRTCAVLRTFGSHGSGPGEIGDVCEGVCFTADGRFLLVAEQSNHRVSMFAVESGAFHRHVGAGTLSNLHKDVQFSHNLEILIANYSNHRICVFNADGDTFLRSFSTREALDVDGAACFPTALAVTCDKLFVLFELDPNVMVFE